MDIPDRETMDPVENRRRMVRGELYYAFMGDLPASRARCGQACRQFNNGRPEASRREKVEMLREILMDKSPLPPVASSQEKDDELLVEEPWVEAPVMMDYGFNVKLGANVFVNFNAVFLDTCPIIIGARTLIGPNCSFYTASHPVEPHVRNGTRGPENGAPITIGEDCWFGGNCIVLPGVTIGRGVTVGAGSVVTKNVPDMSVVAGNPARILRRLEQAGVNFASVG